MTGTVGNAGRSAKVALTIGLSGAAVLVDAFAPTLFFGHSLVLGLVPYLVGTRLVGPHPALVILAAATVTLMIKWHQPFSGLLIALEGVLVAGAWRRRVNPLFADFGYWVLIGTPLSWVLYNYVHPIPQPSLDHALFVQPANGLIAVWLAYLVIEQLPPAPGWNRDGSSSSFQAVLLRRYLVFGTLPVLVGGLLAARTFEERALSEARSNLEATARDLAAQVAQHVAGGMSLIERLADRQIGTNGFTHADRLGRELAQARSQGGFFLTVLAADARGTLVAGANPAGTALPGAPGSRISIADRDYFSVPMTSGRSYVSGVFRGRGFGSDLLVALSTPVISQEGARIGIIEGSMAVDDLLSALERPGGTAGLRLLLTDDALQVVIARGFSYPPLSSLEGRPLGRLVSESPPDARRYIDKDARHPVAYLSMTTAVPGTTWDLTVQREWRDVIRPVIHVYSWILLVTVLTALIASLFAAWSVRDLVEAWQALSRFSVAPAGRAGLLEGFSQQRRLPLEFRDVMARLEEMSRRLESETRQREELLRELESRVRERTRELEGAMQAARAAERAKGAFLATVTHELRTPLTAIINGTRILKVSCKEPTALVGRTLETLEKSGQVLMTVISDVLDYSKLKAGAVTIDVLRFQPAAVLADVAAILEPAARRAGLDFSVRQSTAEELAWEGDPHRLRQVLLNLAGNAVKFTGAGSVGISCRIEGEGASARLWFDVTDTGPGIPPDRQMVIFEPFVQLETDRVMSQAGTGLGLSICRRLVEAMGGGITVDSEVGRGSRFSFWIPRTPPGSAPAI